MEPVAVVDADMLVIWIAPTTPRMVLTSKIFLGISAEPIGMPFREAVERMLFIKSDV